MCLYGLLDFELFCRENGNRVPFICNYLNLTFHWKLAEGLKKWRVIKKRHKNNKNNEKITGFHNSFSLISSFASGYFPFLISLFFLVFTSEMYTATSVLPCHKSPCCCQSPVTTPNMNFQFADSNLFSPLPSFFQLFSSVMGKRKSL